MCHFHHRIYHVCLANLLHLPRYLSMLLSLSFFYFCLRNLNRLIGPRLLLVGRYFICCLFHLFPTLAGNYTLTRLGVHRPPFSKKNQQSLSGLVLNYFIPGLFRKHCEFSRDYFDSKVNGSAFQHLSSSSRCIHYFLHFHLGWQMLRIMNEHHHLA